MLLLTFSQGKPLLVPLTSSLYVPGALSDTEHVLVDVGTGYFIEKKTADAVKFYQGKVETLGKNLADLEKIVAQKSQNTRVVEDGESCWRRCIGDLVCDGADGRVCCSAEAEGRGFKHCQSITIACVTGRLLGSRVFRACACGRAKYTCYSMKLQVEESEAAILHQIRSLTDLQSYTECSIAASVFWGNYVHRLMPPSSKAILYSRLLHTSASIAQHASQVI